jgi:NADH:ubiquinone oxidoreductase subunit K
MLRLDLIAIYLLLTGIMILINKKNYISILIGLEIVTLGTNLFFLYGSLLFDDIHGQIASLLIITTAGLESSIGLALLINLYKIRGSINIYHEGFLKG